MPDEGRIRTSEAFVVRVELKRCCAVLLLVSSTVYAADPKFEFGKPEEVNGVEWKVQSKAGFILSTGNARTTSLAAGIDGSRRSKDNKFSAEANIAYVRSQLLLGQDANGDGFLEASELSTLTQTTTQAWLVSGRYDRFFAEANSLFASARLNSDVPAGRALVAGGQLGYSRRLFKTDQTETLVEAGYDFQHQQYVAIDPATTIHSARVAALHSTQVGEGTLFALEAESLVNLNRETAPNPAGGNLVPPLEDLRFNAGARLTSALTERLSFGFSVRLRYDNVPAPRPPLGIPYAPGFVPFADKLDTVSEASLILTLL